MQRGDEHLPGAGGGRLDCDAILWNRRKQKTGIKLFTLQLCIMLRDTGTGPAGYIRRVLLTLLIYLSAQREVGSDNVLCCPRAAWQGWTRLSGIRVCSFWLVFSLRRDKVTVSCGAAPGNQGEGRAPSGELAGSGRTMPLSLPSGEHFHPSSAPHTPHPAPAVSRGTNTLRLGQMETLQDALITTWRSHPAFR